MRLFVAILFTEEIKDTMIEVLHDMKKQGVGGKYTPKQNMHLTLAFIGERKNPEEVMTVLKGVPFKPFKLSIAESGNFGNLIWAGVKGSQKLKTYVRDLRDALDQAGIPYDKKEFVPHITLIRDASSSKPYKVSVPKQEMMVKKISLMKSENRNGRMVYTEIWHN